MALLKLLKLLLIPVVIMYSCIVLYMFDAISYARQGTQTAKDLFDRSSPLVPNQRQVLLSRYERKGRREVDDYLVYAADQNGVNYGRKGIDNEASLIVISKHPESTSVFSGAEVTFTCQATGDGGITYHWQRVDNGSGLDVSRTSGINSNELIISSVSPDDAGSYVCIASNKNVKTESRIAILDVQVQCSVNVSITNGRVEFSRYRKSVTFHCNGGYRLVGSPLAICTENGTWSVSPPKCAALLPGISQSSRTKLSVHCPTNLSLDNGYVKYSRNHSLVGFQCVSGYQLDGSPSAKCNEDRTWSSPTPKCVVRAACKWSRVPSEFTAIAEHVAANPSELKSAAINCPDRFQWYLRRWSKSTITRLCNSFGISNLTLPILQYKFMYCTGLYFYKYLSDEEGNVRVPRQFHNCKKMSFRNSGIATLLVSWPGSGNSWLRQLLESTTGIYTGSNKDCDLSYINAGMFGEGINSEHVIAVKFHVGPLPEIHFKKVIYIIRNPYDAFVADYQRDIISHDPELFQNSHTHELDMDKFGDYKEWSSYVTRSAVDWRSHIHKWLDSRLPHKATLLVVKFENLLTDLRTELIRIMKYLEYPYTEEDIDCAIRQSDVSFFHRNHTKYFEHYTQMEVDIIYEQIKLAEDIFRKHNISTYKKHVLQT